MITEKQLKALNRGDKAYRSNKWVVEELIVKDAFTDRVYFETVNNPIQSHMEYTRANSSPSLFLRKEEAIVDSLKYIEDTAHLHDDVITTRNKQQASKDLLIKLTRLIRKESTSPGMVCIPRDATCGDCKYYDKKSETCQNTDSWHYLYKRIDYHREACVKWESKANQ